MKNEGLLMAFFIHWYLFLINNLQPPRLTQLRPFNLVAAESKGGPVLYREGIVSWKSSLGPNL